MKLFQILKRDSADRLERLELIRQLKTESCLGDQAPALRHSMLDPVLMQTLVGALPVYKAKEHIFKLS